MPTSPYFRFGSVLHCKMTGAHQYRSVCSGCAVSCSAPSVCVALPSGSLHARPSPEIQPLLRADSTARPRRETPVDAFRVPLPNAYTPLDKTRQNHKSRHNKKTQSIGISQACSQKENARSTKTRQISAASRKKGCCLRSFIERSVAHT